jgi:uncharacterized Ntn-hydrolase superfamily protein
MRFAILSLLVLSACRTPDKPTAAGDKLDMTTWSVVGIDPKNGDVGVAMASCVANTLADALASLVPGKGAAATQAGFVLENRNRVFAALKEGLTAEEVIARAADSTVDRGLRGRQYGVVTMKNGVVTTAGFTGNPSAPGGTPYAGVMADASKGVTVQGNTLVNEAVVGDALKAYVTDAPDGKNLLPDRLLRALEAGAAAGGDARCTANDQKAATAMLVVARGTDAPYATDSLRRSDQGTPAAPWIAISETTPRGGANPIIAVRKRYDELRATLKR